MISTHWFLLFPLHPTSALWHVSVRSLWVKSQILHTESTLCILSTCTSPLSNHHVFRIKIYNSFIKIFKHDHECHYKQKTGCLKLLILCTYIYVYTQYLSNSWLYTHIIHTHTFVVPFTTAIFGAESWLCVAPIFLLISYLAILLLKVSSDI